LGRFLWLHAISTFGPKLVVDRAEQHAVSPALPTHYPVLDLRTTVSDPRLRLGQSGHPQQLFVEL
jgi:hypothetical protein